MQHIIFHTNFFRATYRFAGVHDLDNYCSRFDRFGFAVNIFCTTKETSLTYSRMSGRIRLKFHLARLDSTRHVRLCRASRASRDERVDSVERDEPCSSNMADDERSCTSL